MRLGFVFRTIDQDSLVLRADYESDDLNITVHSVIRHEKVFEYTFKGLTQEEAEDVVFSINRASQSLEDDDATEANFLQILEQHTKEQ